MAGCRVKCSEGSQVLAGTGYVQFAAALAGLGLAPGWNRCSRDRPQWRPRALHFLASLAFASFALAGLALGAGLMEEACEPATGMPHARLIES